MLDGTWCIQLGTLVTFFVEFAPLEVDLIVSVLQLAVFLIRGDSGFLYKARKINLLFIIRFNLSKIEINFFQR